jgi:lipoyl synthase
MPGFAINVAPDMRYLRDFIIPCGIPDRPVTSLSEEGCPATLRELADAVAARAVARWGLDGSTRADVAWKSVPSDLSPFSRGEGPGEVVRPEPRRPSGTSVRLSGRLERAGVVGGLDVSTRKPDWLKAKVVHGPEVLSLRRTIREHGLVTVCEEAGCPNLSECWKDGTATFMILGERCTRACGFCLVDTRHPEPPAADEPARVAAAVAAMGLGHAVVTMVARDDLDDGGAAAVAATIEAIRVADPRVSVEVLISDLRGSADALDTVLEARPAVLNHNLETVARLQHAVRPSAGYARSLGVLARAKRAGSTTKSGLIVGMGERDSEVEEALFDLASVGVDIVTIGQYLRPTTNHLPVARWVEPAVFEQFRTIGEGFGIGHVESSPLTRSSYHAGAAAARVGLAPAEAR